MSEPIRLKSRKCDLIGFTYDGNSADWGIEGYYSNTLNGVDGRKFGYWGSGSDLQQTIINLVDGDSVVSTVDANIQGIAEKYIAKFEETYKSGPYSTTSGCQEYRCNRHESQRRIRSGMAAPDPYDLNNPRDLSSFIQAMKFP